MLVITGSDGFIGTNLRNLCDEEGIPYQLVPEDCHPDFPRNCRVIHLGAMPGIKQCDDDPEASFQANVASTHEYLMDAAEKGCRRFLFASSAAAVEPTTIYGSQKAACEELLKGYPQINPCAVRICNVFGPHSLHKTSVVAQMCKDAIDWGHVHVLERTDRRFMYVRDLCLLLLREAYAEDDGWVGTEHVSHKLSIRHLADYVAHTLDARIKTTEEDLTIRAKAPGKPCIDHKNIHDKLISTIEWFKENYKP